MWIPDNPFGLSGMATEETPLFAGGVAYSPCRPFQVDFRKIHSCLVVDPEFERYCCDMEIERIIDLKNLLAEKFFGGIRYLEIYGRTRLTHKSVPPIIRT